MQLLCAVQELYGSLQGKKTKPALEEIEPGHFVACWFNKEQQLKNEEANSANEHPVRPKKILTDEKILVVENLKKSFDVTKGMLQRKIGSFGLCNLYAFNYAEQYNFPAIEALAR